jgi:hypothetical protein
MSTFFWLSFFFSAPPHSNQACTVGGTPLLEIRERSETSKSVTTKRIYSTGAWTLRSDTATAKGCFDRKELGSIRRALQRAPWQVTSSPVACFAYDANFTEYVLHGRLRYTHRMCSGKTADYDTLAAIDLVNRELAEEMPPPPPAPPVTPTPAPPPPVKPPVASCAAAGVPLFEIRHRSEAQQPTWTMSIYSNGAWVRSRFDIDGGFAGRDAGCFDKATLIAIRDAIHDAPWDVTVSSVVCRAYSPSFTEYYVHGKYEYTARLCGEQRIDATSAASIQLIEAAAAKVLPAEGPVTVRDHR